MKSLHEMFNESFDKPAKAVSKEKEKCAESVMDYPQGEELSPEIWDMVDGTWTMKPEVKERARHFADWAVENFALTDPIVRIVGSMCSNTYDDDADIDIHITDTTLADEDCERITFEMRRVFRDEFGEDGSDMLGTHPFELYVQNNPYRDLMSVGCYDLETDTWETGPLIRPADYDPYSANYQAIYSQNSEIVFKIRDYISSLQEFVCTARLSEKSGRGFYDMMETMAVDLVDSAKILLKDARDMRGNIVDPDSEQEARMARESRMWYVSDATFKLLAKFGYISVLKKVSEIDHASDLASFADAITAICGEKLYPQMFENVPVDTAMAMAGMDDGVDGGVEDTEDGNPEGDADVDANADVGAEAGDGEGDAEEEDEESEPIGDSVDPETGDGESKPEATPSKAKTRTAEKTSKPKGIGKTTKPKAKDDRKTSKRKTRAKTEPKSVKDSKPGDMPFGKPGNAKNRFATVK